MMKILFVCTGNICRSPTAEAMFRARLEAAGLQDRIHCDSGGTHGYHVGENPDPRSIAAARTRGVEMGHLVARRVLAEDYDAFDLLLAMDKTHLRHLQRTKPANSKGKVALYLDYAGITHTQEVPDPYYEGPKTFEQVLDLTEEASDLLLAQIIGRITPA